MRAVYVGIRDALDLSIPIEEYLEARSGAKCLRRVLPSDYTASRGEYLNGLLLADLTWAMNLSTPPKWCFSISAENTTQSKTIDHAGDAGFGRREDAVIPGFYGSMPDGSIKTFSRGGSDVTGAIVAAAAECGSL